MHLKRSSAVCLGLNVISADHGRVRLPTLVFTVPADVLTLVPIKTSGPFYEHGLTLIPAWISNYIHYNVWDEITYPFLNFNGVTVEV